MTIFPPIVYYIEINSLGLAILFLIFLNTKKHSAQFSLERKLFLAMVISAAILLVFDTLMWAFDNTAFPSAREVNIFVSAAYFIFSPLPAMHWAFYADFMIHGDALRHKKIMAQLFFPFALNAFFSIMSVFKEGFYFYVNGNNTYHRENLFLLSALLVFFYLIYVVMEMLIYKQKIEKKTFYTMLTYPLPPLIGSIFQLAAYGLTLTSVCMAISILIVFIDLQSRQMTTDHLTGLNNRRQLDNYLNWKINGGQKNKILAGLMLDLDNFKEINDTYGHVYGDDVLECIGDILRKSAGKKYFPARYGGDEFVMIMDVDYKNEILSVIDRINNSIGELNKEDRLPQKITSSIGMGIYNKEIDDTAQQFLKRIDKIMYSDKRQKQSPAHFSQ